MSAAPVESQQYQGGAPAAGLNGHSGAAPIDTSVPAHAADGTSAGPLSAGGASTISNGLNPKEAKSMHKVLEKEEKREDKNIKSTVKEVAKAEKAEHKAEKADSKAVKEHSKAVKAEHEAAKALERAQAKHEAAVREANTKLHEIDIKKEHHNKVSTGLHNAKSHLDELSSAREQHHVERAGKLSELEAIIDNAKSK